MKVVTPGEVARNTGSKYLGVLVAAKHARSLNEFRRGQVVEESYDPYAAPREKLTTVSLDAVVRGEAPFRLVERRRTEL